MENIKLVDNKPGIAYKLLKLYVRIVYCNFYFRKVYFLNKENIPSDCPLIVVSDHQNSLNDALGLVFAINSRGSRKLRAFTRADAFDRPFMRYVLKGVGLMPAFRLEFQGLESVYKNEDIFDDARHELLNNGTIIIFPEANHKGRHAIRKFSQGYLRLLFDAAEASGFEKEMFVLPVCNHYSDYLAMREEMLIKFGKPIPLAPYYQQYKEKPKTTLREVNRLVQQKVADLMLNITNENDYDAIDYIRNSYGAKYASAQNLNYRSLPEKLHVEKLLVEELDKQTVAEPERMQALYDQTSEFAQEVKRLKIKDEHFNCRPSFPVLTISILVLLFPFFLVSWLLNVIILYIPRIFTRKLDDVILHGAVKMTTSILLTIPLQYLVNFVIFWCLTGSFITALACLIVLPFTYIFAKHYIIAFNNCLGKIRFLKLQTKLEEQRGHIRELLDNLFIGK